MGVDPFEVLTVVDYGDAEVVPGDQTASHAALRRGLERWFAAAIEAGLDEESIVALFDTTRRSLRAEEAV